MHILSQLQQPARNIVALFQCSKATLHLLLVFAVERRGRQHALKAQLQKSSIPVSTEWNAHTHLLQPILIVHILGGLPLTKRMLADVADILLGHFTLLLDVVAVGVLPAQAQLALDHQAVLLDEAARTVDDLFLLHAL